MAIDALDNGQSIYEYKYDFFNYDLTNLIKTYLPIKFKNDFFTKIAFCRSVRLVRYILKKELQFIDKMIEDEKRIAEVYEKAEDKRVLVFYDDISLVSITDKFPDVLFTITKKESGVWVIETVAKK
jgi:uncharacterized UPF0160 family protein